MECLNPLPSCPHWSLPNVNTKRLENEQIMTQNTKKCSSGIQNFGPIQLSLDPLNLGFAVPKRSGKNSGTPWMNFWVRATPLPLLYVYLGLRILKTGKKCLGFPTNLSKNCRNCLKKKTKIWYISVMMNFPPKATFPGNEITKFYILSMHWILQSTCYILESEWISCNFTLDNFSHLSEIILWWSC